MKSKAFQVSAIIPADAGRVYAAWMSGKGHAEMTGAAAKVSAKVGGRFSAWDGYITGKTLELEPHARIVQAWRTTDFPEEAPDSRVTIELEDVRGGARLTITHSDVPPGQEGNYRRGWKDFYFTPMREYFKAAKKGPGVKKR